MQSIKYYISEKLILNKNISSCKYQPENWNELRKILEKRLDEDKDADLNDINVSKITYMKGLFRKLDPHNIKIDMWDVSNVTDMSFMFDACTNFNDDLQNWDVSNVQNMENMFDGCTSLKNKPSWYKE